MKKPTTSNRVELVPGVQLLLDGSLEVHQVTPDRTVRLIVTSAVIDAAADAIRRQGLHQSPRKLAAAALEAAAPSMHARALEEAVEAFPLETITGPDTAVVWLSNRARGLRGEP